MFPGRGGRGSFSKVPNSRGRLGSFLEAFNSGRKRLIPGAGVIHFRSWSIPGTGGEGRFWRRLMYSRRVLQSILVLLVIFRCAEVARVARPDVSRDCCLRSKVFCFCWLGFLFSFIYIA